MRSFYYLCLLEIHSVKMAKPIADCSALLLLADSRVGRGLRLHHTST